MDGNRVDRYLSIIDKGKNNTQSQNLTGICYRIIPSSINSIGIWANDKHQPDFLKYSLPLFELQIGLICAVHNTLHFFLKRFGITEFVSQVLTGIILGPTFLGRFDFMRNVIFPHDSQDIVFTASILGHQMFLFISAVKLDLGLLHKTGKSMIYSGIGVVLIPLILCAVLIEENKKYLECKNMLNEAVNVAILRCFSTFSITAHILEELKIISSEMGRSILSSSLVGDLLGLCLIIILTTFSQDSIANPLNRSSLAIIAFNLAAAFAFRPAMKWIDRHTPQGSPVNSTYIYVIMILVFLSEVYFQSSHRYFNVGACILGFAVPAGQPVGLALVEKFETVITKLFMPVSVAQAVMRADLTLIFYKFSILEFYIVLGLLVFGTKILVYLIASLYSKMSLKDSLLSAAIMISGGVIELSWYLFARDTKTVSEEVYAYLVFTLVLSSAGVSIIVKHSYDPSRKYANYQIRNISSLKPKSRLIILVCVNDPDNIKSTKKLLDAFNPATEKPIEVCVLHLIQLIGRDTPVLISHQKSGPITDPRSQNVIFSFNQYEQKNWNTVSINTYTAINKPKLMNEDISALALDKLVTLILVPLHRRWSVHGRIVAEDQNIRTTNCKVLERAPCSVGIFFDRGKLGRPFSKCISMCMIFLGGNDDREALSLAKRMVKDSSSSNLTVIRLLPEGIDNKDYEEFQVDTWALKEVQHSSSSSSSSKNIVYKEQVVKDGPETALAIHSVMDEFDLFLLGRRHGENSPQTLGLSEWTELPELGNIGDLFASKHIVTRAAVLVVQQQKRIL